MSAAQYNMNVNQGEDFELQIIIKDDTGTPIDLTGNSYAGQIRKEYDSSSVAANFVCTIGDQITDPGLLFVRLPNSTTSAIPCDPATEENPRPVTKFIYDLEETKPDLTITRILEGIVNVSPNVTR